MEGPPHEVMHCTILRVNSNFCQYTRSTPHFSADTAELSLTNENSTEVHPLHSRERIQLGMNDNQRNPRWCDDSITSLSLMLYNGFIQPKSVFKWQTMIKENSEPFLGTEVGCFWNEKTAQNANPIHSRFSNKFRGSSIVTDEDLAIFSDLNHPGISLWGKNWLRVRGPPSWSWKTCQKC